MLISCNKEEVITDGVTITSTSATGTPEGDTNNTGEDADDLVENSTFGTTIQIVYSNSSATITNPVPTDVVITQDGANITVNSSIAGVAYEVSGTTTNGSLKIYSSKKYKLSLNSATITNTTGPAINLQSSKTAFIILEGESTLTDAATYSNIPTDEDAKATLFSEGQLVFSGTGKLNVAANYKHAIVSDDYIRVIGGEINVTQAVSDGIHANNYIIVDGGTIDITATSDGIDCEEGYIIINDGDFNLNVVDDGIAASYDITEETTPDTSINPNVTINGGTFTINTTEGEGIESKGIMTINNGTFVINTYDDGINAIENLYINGGNIYVYSSSNDGIDTNEDLIITGGTIITIGSNAPEEGFDNDNNTFKITGGTLLGLGGATSKPTANVCTQNSVILAGTTANSILHIQAEDGTEALTYKIPKAVSTILYSSSKLTTGTKYTIYTGGSVVSGSATNGLYTSGTYSSGTSKSTFTISAVVTQIGGQIGPG